MHIPSTISLLYCYITLIKRIPILTEVSASFKSGTSVSYTFKETALNELNRSGNGVLPSSIYSDMTLRAENVSLSFRTSQSPALLLYISSYRREYLALLLNKHGERSGRANPPHLGNTFYIACRSQNRFYSMRETY